jgi:molecular chaperone IbpA
MRSYDFSPLLRATVGFDRMMDLLDGLPRVEETAQSYPPYNIERTGEDAYRITMAVAGFAEDELSVSLREGALVIEGKKAKAAEQEPKFLHRGIATRNFQRNFRLADHIKVTGAGLVNGLLHVDLARELPEAMKPRSIAIETVRPANAKVIEGEAA